MGLLSLRDIKDAKERISKYIIETPMLEARGLNEILNCKVYFKPENFQVTGSFKIRGAASKILSLTDAERKKGIIASSSGNHAKGVSFAAKVLGLSATLVLPENAQRTKIEGVKKLGAKVVLHGFDSIERYKKLYEIQAEKGYTVVHSYDDLQLIAGQGTCGYEIINQMPNIDTVIVPLGGGGLLAGTAAAIKESNPNVRVIGVEPDKVPRYSKSLERGEPVKVKAQLSVADGLLITKTGENTYPLIKKYVDEVVTVSDRFIKEGLKKILLNGKVTVEASAAVGVGAVLEGKLKVAQAQKVCFLLTGGNIDNDVLIKLLS